LSGTVGGLGSNLFVDFAGLSPDSGPLDTSFPGVRDLRLGGALRLPPADRVSRRGAGSAAPTGSSSVGRVLSTPSTCIPEFTTGTNGDSWAALLLGVTKRVSAGRVCATFSELLGLEVLAPVVVDFARS
jgi:hypothetical protein